MAPSVSIREYIRWPPRPATEPTSTLVLTTPERRFVDIRVFKVGIDHVSFQGIQSFHQLDWAFAGTSSTTTSHDDQGASRVHSVWKHFVDSRTADPETVVDEGDIFPQPEALRTLERGRMRNPASGKVEEYVESWLDVEPIAAEAYSTAGAQVACVALVLHDDARQERGVVVRIGKWCQGIVRLGNMVSVERWEWTPKSAWKRVVRMGDLWLPCGLAMDPERIKLGGEVKHGGQIWKIAELTEGE